MVGDNYESIFFLVVEDQGISPERGIEEVLKKFEAEPWRLIECKSTLAGRSNRCFGVLLQFHQLCIGVRFLVVDSRSSQGTCEMAGFILHAET